MSTLETRSEVPEPNGAPPFDIRSDPRWRMVERILLTVPFQKSVNLHSLLSYLATHSILGRTDALRERQIGIEVLGKPAGYSPAEDSAVRVHVRQLRLRLHEYFDQEGRSEPLRMDIPKGSYVLEFNESRPEAGPTPLPALKPRSQPWKLRKIRVREALFWIAVTAAVVNSIGWYRSAKANPSVPWPLNAVIQPDRLTTIVVSDSSTMLRQLGQQEMTLDAYLLPGYRQSLIPPHLPENFSRLLNYISDSELTSFADLTVSNTLTKLAGPLGRQLVLTSARDLDRRDLERGNYVFVGSPTSNPWVSLFADQLNFQVVEEGVGGKMYFVNKKPLPGEQKIYQGLAQTGSAGQEYATISLLPGSMGQGNILILQGLRQEGTEALGMLLSDAADRTQLQKALGIREDGRNSPYFEALIQTQAVAGAPVAIRIVTIRTIHR